MNNVFAFLGSMLRNKAKNKLKFVFIVRLIQSFSSKMQSSCRWRWTENCKLLVIFCKHIRTCDCLNFKLLSDNNNKMIHTVTAEHHLILINISCFLQFACHFVNRLKMIPRLNTTWIFHYTLSDPRYVKHILLMWPCYCCEEMKKIIGFSIDFNPMDDNVLVACTRGGDWKHSRLAQTELYY